MCSSLRQWSWGKVVKLLYLVYHSLCFSPLGIHKTERWYYIMIYLLITFWLHTEIGKGKCQENTVEYKVQHLSCSKADKQSTLKWYLSTLKVNVLLHFPLCVPICIPLQLRQKQDTCTMSRVTAFTSWSDNQTKLEFKYARWTLPKLYTNQTCRRRRKVRHRGKSSNQLL